MLSVFAAVVVWPLAVGAAPAPGPAASTCGDIKEAYRSKACCGSPDKISDFQIVPMPSVTTMFGNTNFCHNKKPKGSQLQDGTYYFDNQDCVEVMLEQSGTNVTVGYMGDINTTGRGPITTPYYQAGLCPVNVHWHLGAEHLSVGEYDETGTGPVNAQHADEGGEGESRRLATTARLGFRCKKYDANDPKFTTPYAWKFCRNDTVVGETYEVHWPHSAAGACGTPYQYQSPFYDGVFCMDGIVSLDPLNTFSKIGVQSQIFTIVNDESYYYPDLIRGMIVEGEYGQHLTKYTGSTTGTSRNNVVCSKFTPITWQVDRKCQLISASSFDKMCADMLAQADDMSGDLYAHGSRELVNSTYSADNHQRL